MFYVYLFGQYNRQPVFLSVAGRVPLFGQIAVELKNLLKNALLFQKQTTVVFGAFFDRFRQFYFCHVNWVQTHRHRKQGFWKGLLNKERRNQKL